jgi:Lon protease-like protein
VDADGSVALVVRGLERFALIAPLDASTLYPRWEVQPYPDEGGAGTDDVEAAVGALRRYLAASGEPGIRPVVPHDPVAASWAIAAAVPGVPAARQRLLEAPGAGERLRSARDILTLETRLLRTLGAGIAAAEEPASLN